VHHLRDRNGFGVVEILAALSIFSIVAAGLAVNSVTAVRANRVSRELSVASALAQDKIEQLRAMDPASNPFDLMAGWHADANNPLTATAQRGGIFIRQWTVVKNIPALGLSTVVVQVTWNDSGVHSMRMIGYLCASQACA
jgi:prepilin-type N-terminal cleavage/methylation domain-containing protein